MNKLILLVLATIAAFSMPHAKADPIAYSKEVNGYGVTAMLFLDQEGLTSIGFTHFDPDCLGYSPKLKPAGAYYVGDVLMPFQYQCFKKSLRLEMTKTVGHNELVVEQFRANEYVKLSTEVGDINMKFYTAGFGHSLDNLVGKP